MIPLAMAALAADPPSAPGTGDPEVAFARARSAEREGRFAEAVGACRELVSTTPTGPRAPACRALLARTEARRDPDGTWTSWAALEAVRKAVRAEGAAALRPAVETLARSDRAAPTVRAEADLWLALDALDRLDDPTGALARVSPWLTGANAPGDPALVDRLTAARDTAEQRLGTAGPDRPLGPTDADLRALRERRARWSGLSLAAVVGFVLLAARPALRGWRLRPRPLGLLPLGIAGLGSAALLALRGDGGVDTALGATAALAGLHLLAVGALLGSTGPWRTLLRLAAAVASAAAVWLALDLTGMAGAVGG